MNKRRKFCVLALLITFLFNMAVPAFADEAENNHKLTLEEIQNLAVEHSRNLEKIDLITDQVTKLKYIYNNEYNRVRSNKVGNYVISKSEIDNLTLAMQDLNTIIKAQTGGEYDLFNESDLKRAYQEQPDLVPFLNQFSLLRMQAGLYEQTTNLVSEMTEGQMDLLKGLGVAGYDSIVKELKERRNNAEDQLEDLERTRIEAEEQIKQLVTLLAFETIKLEKNIKLLEKVYDQYLKMTEVERLKKKYGLSNEAKVKEIAIETSNYGKQLNFARDSLKILKGKINDLIGRSIDEPLEIVEFKVPESPVPAPSYNSIIDKVLENTYEFHKNERETEDLEDEIDDIEGSNEKEIKKREVEKLELDLKDYEVEVRNNIKGLIAEYNKKLKAYQLALVNYDKAKQEFEWKKLELENELISPLMYTGAELEYIKALNEKIAAAYDYYLVKTELEKAQKGIFMPDDYTIAKNQFSRANN